MISFSHMTFPLFLEFAMRSRIIFPIIAFVGVDGDDGDNNDDRS